MIATTSTESESMDPRLGQLNDKPATPRFLLDMVHHNPGEPEFETRYTDSSVLAESGYNGRVFMLFESAQLAVDWADVDASLFPVGSESREWLEAKATELRKKYRATKEAGLSVFCQCDMVLFPRQLVESQRLERFEDPRDERTRYFLKILLHKMFDQFDDLDGIVIRVGETYLHDAPYHIGGIRNKGSADETLIPLMNLLREVVCETLDKKVFFRTWLSFDRPNDAMYRRISDRIEPHRNLIISDKHCEDDFHRGNRFSRFLGLGRHPQIVEIQCQREYEGKGAYPNYVAHGIIEGFKEYDVVMEPGQMRSLREFVRHPLYAGAWTWSRGGGWEGPYLNNELWIDLNVYVLSHWLRQPERSEESVFLEFAEQRLGLSADDSRRFRELCLLSAAAVVRGKRSTHADIEGWWSRDHFIGTPPLPDDSTAMRRVLDEKREAVVLWEKIVDLAGQIRFRDTSTAEFVTTSCCYGLILYAIYRVGFDLAAAQRGGKEASTEALVEEYDNLQCEMAELHKQSSACATLYRDVGFREDPEWGGIGQLVDSFRH